MDAFESLSHFFNAINEVYYRIDNQYKIGVKLDCLSAETEKLLNGSLDFKSSDDLNATKSYQIYSTSPFATFILFFTTLYQLLYTIN